jgi:hypothetical protein
MSLTLISNCYSKGNLLESYFIGIYSPEKEAPSRILAIKSVPFGSLEMNIRNKVSARIYSLGTSYLTVIPSGT